MKGKYLITTDAWFIATDGRTYKADAKKNQTAKE